MRDCECFSQAPQGIHDVFNIQGKIKLFSKTLSEKFTLDSGKMQVFFVIFSEKKSEKLKINYSFTEL